MNTCYIKTKTGPVLADEWYENIPEIFRSTFGGLDKDMYTLDNGYNFGVTLTKLANSQSQIQHGDWKKDWLNYPGFSYNKNSDKSYYKEMPVALATVHGSQLYGNSHAGSDDDRYIVIDDITVSGSVKSKQTVKGGDDVLILGLKQYLDILALGSHQALEAKFSPRAFIDEGVATLISSSTPGAQSMSHKYMSASKSFFLLGAENRLKKKINHSLRLLKDYSDFNKYGRIFPTKTSEQLSLLGELNDNILRNIK